MKLIGQLAVLAALSLGSETLVSIELKGDCGSEHVWTFWRREESVATVGKQILG
jgi:hypothetical protein